jgi:lipopolysaccharide transport system permease protein
MLSTKQVRIYTPNVRTTSILGSLKIAWSEIVNSKHVIWHLFKRDFVAQFRQKIFGYFWVLITPVMGIIPFLLIYKMGNLNPGQTLMPYPIFIVIGSGIWGFLMNTFTVVSSGLQGNQDLLMRTNIPKITFALTGMANILYSLLVHCVVITIIIYAVGIRPSLISMIYPLTLIPIILLGTGLGLVFSVLGSLARDLSSMAGTCLNTLMYLSAVVYQPVHYEGWLGMITNLNPLTYLVDVPRCIFVLGRVSYPGQYLLATLFSAIIFILGIHSFYMIKDKIAERL